MPRRFFSLRPLRTLLMRGVSRKRSSSWLRQAVHDAVHRPARPRRQYLPDRDPFLLIANHASHLDTVALLSLFPLSRVWRIRPVAAADILSGMR